MEEEKEPTVSEVDEGSPNAELAAKLARCRDELKRCQTEKRDYLDTAQRLRADYLNLQKELAAVRATAGRAAEEALLKEFFPIIDGLEAGLNHPAGEAVSSDWRRGLEQIYSQVKNFLSRLGVEEISAETGEKFDPVWHIALETTSAVEAELDGRIAAVLQKGYRRMGVTLRPVGVRVWHFKS